MQWIVQTYLDNLDYFECDDRDFIEGRKRHKPLDFDLHLALNLLKQETCPTEILNTIEQWVKENPVAGTKYPDLTTMSQAERLEKISKLFKK